MLELTALEPNIQEAAGLMEMLSNPARLRILCLLTEGERSVSDITAHCVMSQPAISQHLKKMRDSGIVDTRRDAQTIYYSLKGDEVRAVMETLHGIYCAEDPAS